MCDLCNDKRSLICPACKGNKDFNSGCARCLGVGIIDCPKCSGDPLLEKAKEVSREVGYVSVTYLQRKLRVGYTRASSIVDKLIMQEFCEKQPSGWRYRLGDDKENL